MSHVQRIEAAAALVHGAIGSSPQISWPLLSQRIGAETWVKHENHLPTGAFKVRGGLTYIDRLRREQPNARGVIAATRGNHGQSIAFAARQFGLPCVVVVPHGNSRSKNAAMRAYGAELIETGDDFQAAYDSLCADLDAGREPPIDDYAGTEPAEFFAVCSEYWFTAPDILRAAYPVISAAAIIACATRVLSSFKSTRMRDFIASEVPAAAKPTITAAIELPPKERTAKKHRTNGVMNPPSAASSPAHDARPSSAGSISIPM